jgi:hypothetical protein
MCNDEYIKVLFRKIKIEFIVIMNYSILYNPRYCVSETRHCQKKKSDYTKNFQKNARSGNRTPALRVAGEDYTT